MTRRRPVPVCTPSCGHSAVSALLDEWTAARQVLAELEREEHPDIVDTQGRTWSWVSGDLYRHDGKAWPRAFIEEKR